MNRYINGVKEKLNELNNVKIASEKQRLEIIDIIEKLLDDKSFLLNDFVNDKKSLTYIINNISDKNLLINFKNLLKELKNIPWVKLVSSQDKDTRETKEKFFNVLKSILKELKNNVILYYTKLDFYISFLDDVGVKIVDLDKYSLKVLENLGFPDSDILMLCNYITKKNMDLYSKKIKSINKEQEAKENAELERKLKKESNIHKRNVLDKRCSSECKRLLEKTDALLNSVSYDIKQVDSNMAFSYKEFYFKNDNEVLSSLADNAYLKYLYINIKSIRDYIDKEKHNKTQEELQEELNELSNLYDLYVNRTNEIKQETETESESKNNYQDNDKLNNINNIYYLTDDKGIKYTDYARDKHNNDKAFLKDLEIILSNFEKGGYRTSLKQIKGLDNCYYIQKNKTCVSIKMLDKNNYIVITSDKPKDFFSTTIKLHNKELDKINEIKKGIVGDSK